MAAKKNAEALAEEKSDLLGFDRTVEFYHILQAELGKPDLDIEVLVAKLLAEPETDRWLQLESNGERFDCWYDGKGEKLHKFRIGITRSRVRDKRLNKVTAKVSAMGLTKDEEMCVEAHLLLFPDGFAAFEFVPNGPRLSQFTEFLSRKYLELGRIKFDVAANKNFDENLKKVKRFNSLQVTVSDGNSKLYEIADPDYYKQVSRSKDKTGASKVRTIYFADRKDPETFKQFCTSWALKISKVKEAEPKLTEEQIFKQMQMKFKGPDKESAVKRSIIELTCSKITALRFFYFAKPVTDKHIDSARAYEAIRDAYDSVLPDLRNSKAIGVDE